MMDKQGVGAGFDGAGAFALLGAQGGIEQQIDHADDAVHRRADFVAHVREKFAFGLAGHERGLGQFLGFIRGEHEHLVCRAQPGIGRFKRLGAFADHLFQIVEPKFRLLEEPPFFSERNRELQCLDGVEWFFQDDQPVGVAEPLEHFLPRVIRICGADHHLEVRIFLPDLCGGLDAVPSGRHPDIHESHGVRDDPRKAFLDQIETFLPLKRGIDIEFGQLKLRNRSAKQCGFVFIEIVAAAASV